MSSRHVVTAGVVLGSFAAATQGASVSLVTDGRAVESTAWAGDPFEPVVQSDRVEATGDETFDGVVDLAVSTPDAALTVAARAEQTSTVTVLADGGFEFSGSLLAASTTSLQTDTLRRGGPPADGFGSPLSVFDIEIDTDVPMVWELELTMETAGEAATSFNAFDFSYLIQPMGSDSQSFSLTGEIDAGRYRILADVTAPTDPFLGGTRAKLDFTLRGTAVAAPIPTAFASAGAILAAALLRRKR